MIAHEYFDFPSAGAEAGFSETQMRELFDRTLAEHHGDRMMAELRMLRTCSAVAKGYCTVEEAMAAEPGSSPRPDFRVAEDGPPYGSET